MDPLHVAALTTTPLFIWYFWSRGFNRCSSENEFMSRFEFSPLWFWFCSLILVLVGSLFRFWSHLTKLKHAADRNHPLLLQIWASCQNVSCDFCIYFFISLLFYVQRWTDFEASSTWEETFAAWRVSSSTDFLIIRLNVPSDFRCIIHSDIMFIHLISVCYFALGTKASETVRALRVSHVCPS